MEHASLIAFLDGLKPVEEFRDEIRREVEYFAEWPDFVDFDDLFNVPVGPYTKLTAEHLVTLLQALLNDELPFVYANYVAECMYLSHTLVRTNRRVVDAIEFVRDDSYPPTKDRIRTWIARLKS